MHIVLLNGFSRALLRGNIHAASGDALPGRCAVIASWLDDDASILMRFSASAMLALSYPNDDACYRECDGGETEQRDENSIRKSEHVAHV
jgi:hypothetical protein